MIYIINENNHLYKNYCIRKHSSGYYIINYRVLLEEVHYHLNIPHLCMRGTPCVGNWGEYRYAGGLVPYPTEELPVFTSLEKVHDFIDKKVSQFPPDYIDELWFFICLLHFTDPVYYFNNRYQSWDYSYLKILNLQQMFNLNKIKTSIKKLLNDKQYEAYFVEKEFIHDEYDNEPGVEINPNVLFKAFFNQLVTMLLALPHKK